jgi:hypothetical protein
MTRHLGMVLREQGWGVEGNIRSLKNASMRPLSTPSVQLTLLFT